MKRTVKILSLLLVCVLAAVMILPSSTKTVRAVDATINISIDGEIPFDITSGGYKTLTNTSDVSNINLTVNSVGGVPLVGVATNSGSVDNEGRDVLEVQTISRSATQWTFNLNYHADDDTTNNGGNHGHGFYVTGITLLSNAAEGLSVTGSKTPDMYQNTVFTKNIDIASSTAANPADVAVYFDGSFNVASLGGKTVTNISVVDGFNANAVTISGSSVTFNSGYYTSVPLKVTLDGTTEGYIRVNRIGIEVEGTSSAIGKTWINHGSQLGTDMAGKAGAGGYNVVAVFYYPASQSYSDYDVVANLTFSDGRVETKVVEGFAEYNCANDASLDGGEYWLWNGDSQDAMPTSVSVTAVRHGALSGGNFTGATFGSGMGVTETRQGFDYRR